MGGRRSIFYSFKNNSQKPCKLKGWPAYVLLNSAGHQIKPPMPPGEGVPDDPKPVTLTPGGKAFFSVNYTSCSSASATGRQNRCKHSAKARISALGIKRTFIIRESINLEGRDYDVSPIASTLKELGLEIEKPKP
jgi:hypothetical protein